MNILTSFVYVILFCSFLHAQLNGTYTVGPGGNFDSLGGAISALNTQGVNGSVTILLLNGTHTIGKNIALGCSGTSSVNTITIKPNTGATVIVNFTDATSAASIDGHFVIGSPTASNTALVPTYYVTIDGSNNGTTSKDLIFNGPSTTYQVSTFRIFGNNDHITIKNCIINNNSISVFTTAPIYVTNYFNGTNYSPDHLIIQNNTLSGTSGTASVGIHVTNTGASTGCTDLTIGNNIINGNQRGCYISYTLNADIHSNTFSVVSTGTTANTAAFGILMQSNLAAEGVFNIYNNKFNALFTRMTAAASASNGIIAIDNQNLNPHIVNIYNNFIGGFAVTGSANNAKMYGIRCSGSATTNIYHNSIHIPELSNMSTPNHIAGIAFAAAATVETAPSGTAVIKNNIIKISETSMKVYGIRRIETNGTFVSDHNIIDVAVANSTGYTGFYNTNNYQTLSEWTAATGNDDHSHAESIEFVSTTDLHLSGTSDGNSVLIGTSGLGISEDIDGESRNSTAPYMGADESGTTLPVEITSFTAVPTHSGISLQWRTASERNNSHFIIQRRDEQTSWKSVGMQPGTGDSNFSNEYHFFDAAPPGLLHYRLLKQDRDGKITAGPSLEVFAGIMPEHSTLHQNHPNPFNPSTAITYLLAKNGMVKLSVYDAEGKEIRILVNTYQPAGSYTIRFLADGLPSGVYVYRLLVHSMTYTKKMLFIK